MKIVKQGELPEDQRWPKQVTCYKCHSVLEYDKADIRPAMDIREDDYVTCPFCKACVTLVTAKSYYNK